MREIRNERVSQSRSTLMTNPTLIDLLYKALRAEVGIIVDSNDPPKLRQRLYVVRRESGDEDLNTLSFLISRTYPESQLLIVRKDAGQDKVKKTHPIAPSG